MLQPIKPTSRETHLSQANARRNERGGTCINSTIWRKIKLKKVRAKRDDISPDKKKGRTSRYSTRPLRRKRHYLCSKERGGRKRIFMLITLVPSFHRILAGYLVSEPRRRGGLRRPGFGRDARRSSMLWLFWIYERVYRMEYVCCLLSISRWVHRLTWVMKS